MSISLLVTGCGGGDDGSDDGRTATDETTSAAAEPDEGSSTEPAVEESTDAPTDVATDVASVDNDICDLLTDEEVAGALGAPGTVATDISFGSLSDEFGGQCVWTDDPAGDAYASGASTLEIVVFVPDGGMAPEDAPEPGSTEVVEDPSGAYFASADRVFWLRFAGSKAMDEGNVAKARELVPAIQGRL